ncbi:hypothetical protein STENM36S_01533 [Streptomyces tendae]
MLAGRVDRHGAPAAADVEEALTGAQVQLAADEFELVALGVLQGAALGRRGGPIGAGVDHGGAEDEFVEVVAHVVVVADGPLVAALGVQVAAGPADLLRRRGGRQRRPGEPHQAAYGGPDLGVAQRLDQTAGVLAALPDEAGQQAEGGVEVPVDVDVARHPGAGQAQFARFEQQAAQGPAVADDEGRRARRTRLRTVPGADAHRERCSQQLFEEVLQPQRGVSHGVLRDERSRNVQHHVNTWEPAVQSPARVTTRQNSCTHQRIRRSNGAAHAQREGAARTTDGGRPLRGYCWGLLRPAATGGQEALASVFSCLAAFSPWSAAFGAAGFGAGLAAS